MKGYKYGVWLVYKQELFKTKHIGHFTVKCFMEELDAKELNKKLKEEYGRGVIIELQKEGMRYDKKIYKSDNNELLSWGYNGIIKEWDKIEELCLNYGGDFSKIPHTSINYSKNEEEIIDMNERMTIEGEFVVADINGEPKDWKLIFDLDGDEIFPATAV